MSASPTKSQAARFGAWKPWLTIAVVAILTGLVLPQMMPGETVVPPKSSRSETKDKSNLEYNAPSMPETPNFQGMIVRLGIGTTVVLGLCVATLFGLRRWLNPPAGPSDPDREMRLVETLNLGGRCALHLVHLGKREVLVGVDSSGIKTMLPLSESFADVLTKSDAPALDAPEASRPAA